MAKTQYHCAATLDGYIADPDDGIDWLTGYQGSYDGPSEPAESSIDAFLEGVGALVMGSATYEFIHEYGSSWPYGERPTWVLTRRELQGMEGAEIQFHDGPVTDIHPQMLEAAGERNLWVVGGGGVASDLQRVGLLDELLVAIVPVVLGSGKPLFEAPIPTPMQLLRTRAFDSGMVELVYALK